MNIGPKRRSGRGEKKREIRESQLTWLRRVLEATGKTPSGLSLAAGLADNTLKRFLNPEGYEGTLSPLTVRIIADHTGLPGPEGEPLKNGRAFEEGKQFDYATTAQSAPVLAEIVRALVRDRPNAAPWVLHTHALEGAGYLAGDLVIVEMTERAPRLAAVCAQVYDMQRGTAQTVFRIYEPPVLTGANRNVADRPAPLVVDDDRVKIMGVITNVVRMAGLANL